MESSKNINNINGYVHYPERIISPIHNYDDVMLGSTQDWIEQCDRDPKCRGFDRHGYKKSIDMPNRLCKTVDPTERNCYQIDELVDTNWANLNIKFTGSRNKWIKYPEIPGYKKILNKRIPNVYDIKDLNMSESTLGQRADVCSRQPECQAFDSDGHLKHRHVPTEKCKLPDPGVEWMPQYCFWPEKNFATYVKSTPVQLDGFVYHNDLISSSRKTNRHKYILDNYQYYAKDYQNLATACLITPRCSGFGTDGNLLTDQRIIGGKNKIYKGDYFQRVEGFKNDDNWLNYIFVMILFIVLYQVYTH